MSGFCSNARSGGGGGGYLESPMSGFCSNAWGGGGGGGGGEEAESMEWRWEGEGGGGGVAWSSPSQCPVSAVMPGVCHGKFQCLVNTL